MAANILADAFQVALLINTCSLTKGLPFTVDHIGVHKSNYACGWTACGQRGLPQASRFALISHIRSHTGETRPTSRWGGLKLQTRSPFTQSTLEVDGLILPSPPDTLSNHLRAGVLFPLASLPPIPTVDTDVYTHTYAYPLAKQLSPIAEWDSFSPISTASDGADSSEESTPSNSNPGSSGPTAGFEDTSKFS